MAEVPFRAFSGVLSWTEWATGHHRIIRNTPTELGGRGSSDGACCWLWTTIHCVSWAGKVEGPRPKGRMASRQREKAGNILGVSREHSGSPPPLNQPRDTPDLPNCKEINLHCFSPKFLVIHCRSKKANTAREPKSQPSSLTSPRAQGHRTGAAPSHLAEGTPHTAWVTQRTAGSAVGLMARGDGCWGPAQRQPHPRRQGHPLFTLAHSWNCVCFQVKYDLL